VIGRVAITCPPESLMSDMSIHIGHARTLLLGDLICRERGIPFHVRIDGLPHPASHDLLIDLSNCLFHLGIAPTRIYWPTVPPDTSHMSEVFNVTTHLAGPAQLSSILDDILNDNLIIRGLEFRDINAAYHGSADALSAVTGHVRFEDRLYELAGKTKDEVNVPLIIIGGGKMSKTAIRVVHWSILGSIHTDVARSFLLSTAMFPDDPIGHLAEEFHMDKVSERPYRWSWDHWNELILLVGRDRPNRR